MAGIKTQKTGASVEAFLNGIADEKRRADAFRVVELMREATGEEPAMWGPAIVGFGDYRYPYENGRGLDWFLAGFSPRKANLALYLIDGLENHGQALRALGKHTTGASCLYIKRLADVDLDALKGMVERSVARLKGGG